MKAMVLEKPGVPLKLQEIPEPVPGPDDVLIRVTACAVCRTDLHIVDGELTEPKLPLVPGHEIVGQIVSTGSRVTGLNAGDRVGVPWLGSTCRNCEYCHLGSENLCDNARFTGYHTDGGYAQFTLADHRFVLALSESGEDVQIAPLMCAGLIGYRSYRMAGACKSLGLFGFGAAAHIITQVAIQQGVDVYAFTRPGDDAAGEFALKLGAVWAGDSSSSPPGLLDAAIIYAPVGQLVPAALKVVRKGGRVVCAGIHMSNIPEFPYRILWGERQVCSVANLTRKDGIDFLESLKRAPVSTSTEVFPLADANVALDRLRQGKLSGAAVLVPDP